MTTIFIPLPHSIRRDIAGGCVCAYCRMHPGATPQWDTLGYDPDDGYAWTVHDPERANTPLASRKPPLKDYEITFVHPNEDWTWVYEQAKDYHDAMALALDLCPVGARVHSIVFMTPEQIAANKASAAARVKDYSSWEKDPG